MKNNYEPFGRVCVKLGFCTSQDVEKALDIQRTIERDEKKRVLLGIIMLEHGMIDNNQLIQVLQYYKDHTRT